MPRRTKQPTMVRESAPAYGVIVAERGRVVLPSTLRRRLAIKAGDRLVLTEEGDGVVRMVRRTDLVRQLQGSWRPPAGGRLLSDALIAERRREAAREDTE